ncbi:MAG: V-type ATPase subunit a family protein [Bacillota bacterium]|nr:V-type ATPase subunit a family protein [Bacillota bacterium]
MENSNLEQAKSDIEEALSAIDSIMEELNQNNEKKVIKERFLELTEKLDHIEQVLKEEGILE